MEKENKKLRKMLEKCSLDTSVRSHHAQYHDSPSERPLCAVPVVRSQKPRAEHRDEEPIQDRHEQPAQDHHEQPAQDRDEQPAHDRDLPDIIEEVDPNRSPAKAAADVMRRSSLSPSKYREISKDMTAYQTLLRHISAAPKKVRLSLLEKKNRCQKRSSGFTFG